MATVEVSYKVNTMGAAVFTNKFVDIEPEKITLQDFKNLFKHRHHVSTQNFRLGELFLRKFKSPENCNNK